MFLSRPYIWGTFIQNILCQDTIYRGIFNNKFIMIILVKTVLFFVKTIDIGYTMYLKYVKTIDIG